MCVTDLPDLQNANLSTHQDNLFVDTKLANESAANVGKHRHATVSVPDARSTMWNPPACFY